MIDIDREELLPLKAVCAHPVLRRPDGRAPDLTSVYRWISSGIVGASGERNRLEVVRVPGGMRTSREAIGRFIARLSGHVDDASPTAPNDRKLSADVAEQQAVELLDAAGIR